MAIVSGCDTSGLVRRQYEDFPYPPRDPADELRRLLTTTNDDLAVVNHHCYRGRRDFSKNFRVLVAGGGTGDAAVFLAYQLQHTDAAIVYLDLSRPAMEVARQRMERRGMAGRITWTNGSLLDLPKMDVEPFDYVNCSGVLHHLDDPSAGLAALGSVLKDDGVMGLMVYGKYGRTGIYQMQELMRRMNGNETDSHQKVANTRAVYNALPGSHWYKRAAGLFKEPERWTDADVYDMFLHSTDRAYSIPELYELLDGAGLNLAQFVDEHRAHMNPHASISDPEVLRLVAELPLREQQAVMELMWGCFIKHTFWATRQTGTSVDCRDTDHIPVWAYLPGANRFAEQLTGSSEATMDIRIKKGEFTVTTQVVTSDVTKRLFALIDNRRSMREIIDVIAAEQPQHAREHIEADCLSVLAMLAARDMLMLRHPSSPPLACP